MRLIHSLDVSPVDSSMTVVTSSETTPSVLKADPEK